MITLLDMSSARSRRLIVVVSYVEVSMQMDGGLVASKQHDSKKKSVKKCEIGVLHYRFLARGQWPNGRIGQMGDRPEEVQSEKDRRRTGDGSSAGSSAGRDGTPCVVGCPR